MFGQEKVPFSKRLASTHRPLPSQYRILSRLRRLLVKAKSAPLRGSSPSFPETIPSRPLKDLRMSQGSTQRKTRMLPGKLSMAVGS